MPLAIPLRSGELLALTTPLPPASEVAHVLAENSCKEEVWLDVARLYGASGAEAAMLDVLEHVRCPRTADILALVCWYRIRHNQVALLSPDDLQALSGSDAGNIMNAWVSVSRGEVAQAQRTFWRLANEAPTNRHLARLSLGSVYYLTLQYEKALDEFRRASRDSFGARVHGFYGIAACLYRLGDIVQCERALQACLDHDANFLPALHLSLQLRFDLYRRSRDPADVFAALQAHPTLQAHEPSQLIRAELLLDAGRSKEASQIATPIAALTTPSLRVRANYLLGLAAQRERNLSAAASYFDRAHSTAQEFKAQLDPAELRPVMLRYAQFLAYLGKNTQARDILVDLTRVYPNDPVANKTLALLSDRLGDSAAVRQYCSLYFQTSPWNRVAADVWTQPLLLYAKHACDSSPITALRCLLEYYYARELHQKTTYSEEDQNVLHNIAMFLLVTGNTDGACQFLDKVDNNRLASQFNRALFMEATGQVAAAEALHREIICSHPRALDCWIQLASLARRRNKLGVAQQYILAASRLFGPHPRLVILSALCDLSSGNGRMAQRKVEALDKHMEETGAKEDPAVVAERFTTLGLAFKAQARDPRLKQIEAKKAEAMRKKALFYAFRCLTKAIRTYQGCYAAAQAVGACLYDSRDYNKARSVFMSVREAFSGVTPPWHPGSLGGSTAALAPAHLTSLHLAHVQCVTGSLSMAAKTYQNLLAPHLGLGASVHSNLHNLLAKISYVPPPLLTR